MKRRLLTLVAALAVTGFAMAQMADDTSWDVNGDETISRTEFYDGLYSQWDTDGEPFVTLEEYRAGLGSTSRFADLDADDDNQVSLAEYNQGMADMGLWSEPEYSRNFKVWDVDRNDMLSADEFVTGSYRTFDANSDEQLDRTEFEQSYGDAYAAWDTDLDYTLSQEEIDAGLGLTRR